MKYLLDADTVTYFLQGNKKLRARLTNTDGQWGISAITYAELSAFLFGTKNETVERLVSEFLRDVDTVPFSSADALEAGRLLATLEKNGTPIGPADTLIAGHALSLGLTLISNNTRHFVHVPDLKLDNWYED